MTAVTHLCPPLVTLRLQLTLNSRSRTYLWSGGISTITRASAFGVSERVRAGVGKRGGGFDITIIIIITMITIIIIIVIGSTLGGTHATKALSTMYTLFLSSAVACLVARSGEHHEGDSTECVDAACAQNGSKSECDNGDESARI